MALIGLTATYKTVDLDLLALLHTRSEEIRRNVSSPGPVLAGTVILSTCNRFEIYGEVPAETDAGRAFTHLTEMLSQDSGLTSSQIALSFTRLSGTAVPEHLFSVGAGLESAVLGEQQIGGQLRRALAHAQSTGSASRELLRLFQAAFRTAKVVGARTALGTAARSMIAVALELAQHSNPGSDLTDSNTLVIGTGAYAASTVALLKEKGCQNISVFSWSGRAEAFAQTRGLTSVDHKDLPAALREASVIVGCSGSGSRLEGKILRAARSGHDHPLTLIDLALTRDFDPESAEVPGVHLITLDSIRSAAPSEHTSTLSQAKALVMEGVGRFEAGQNSRESDWAITALRQHARHTLNTEIDRLKTGNDSATSAEAIEHALRRLLNQLLHTPSVRAREYAKAGRHEEYMSALEALFGLTPPTKQTPAILVGADRSPASER